jgi:hypothetical protein
MASFVRLKSQRSCLFHRIDWVCESHPLLSPHLKAKFVLEIYELAKCYNLCAISFKLAAFSFFFFLKKYKFELTVRVNA